MKDERQLDFKHLFEQLQLDPELTLDNTKRLCQSEVIKNQLDLLKNNLVLITCSPACLFCNTE